MSRLNFEALLSLFEVAREKTGNARALSDEEKTEHFIVTIKEAYARVEDAVFQDFGPKSEHTPR